MRKACFALGLMAALALVACTGNRPSSSGNAAATAPSTGAGSAPAASCGGAGRG